MDSLPAIRMQLESLIRRARTPGLQYLVVGPERVEFEYCGGWADLRAGEPLRVDSTLMAYSMSKTITAAAVLRLSESRGLELDTPLQEHLELCPYGAGVTIRRVLAHTAGIPNPLPLRWVHSPAEHAGFDEPAALAAVLARHPRLAFTPGTRYGYSNIGYWLLGALIERVSGRPFTDYVEGEVLGPLGVAAADLGYWIPTSPPHARGYLEKYSLTNLLAPLLMERRFLGAYESRWREIHAHYLDGAAFGGLVGTARGFGRFLQDQLRPRSVLFGDAVREQSRAQQHALDGTALPTALGWHIGTFRGSALDRSGFLYKEGGGAGYHCLMRLYPGCGRGTVLLTNASGFGVHRLLDRIDPAFLAPA